MDKAVLEPQWGAVPRLIRTVDRRALLLRPCRQINSWQSSLMLSDGDLGGGGDEREPQYGLNSPVGPLMRRSARNAPGPWFQNCRVKPRGCSASSARRIVARRDFDRLLDSISSNGSPRTSRTSVCPPGAASSKTPIASRPVYHASVSRLVRFFLKIGPCAC